MSSSTSTSTTLDLSDIVREQHSNGQVRYAHRPKDGRVGSFVSTEVVKTLVDGFNLEDYLKTSFADISSHEGRLASEITEYRQAKKDSQPIADADPENVSVKALNLDGRREYILQNLQTLQSEYEGLVRVVETVCSFGININVNTDTKNRYRTTMSSPDFSDNPEGQSYFVQLVRFLEQSSRGYKPTTEKFNIDKDCSRADGYSFGTPIKSLGEGHANSTLYFPEFNKKWGECGEGQSYKCLNAEMHGNKLVFGIRIGGNKAIEQHSQGIDETYKRTVHEITELKTKLADTLGVVLKVNYSLSSNTEQAAK